MFITRITSVCVLIPIVMIVISQFTITQFTIFTFFICLISAWEWGKMMKFSVCMYRFWMCVTLGLLSIIMDMLIFRRFLCFDVWNIYKYVASITVLWWIIAFLLVCSYPTSSIYWKNSNMLRCFFGIAMIVPFFWGILTLRQLYYVTIVSDNNGIGVWWLLYVLILVWINDSGAYIFGKILGKYKLLEKVSPRKTWEGCIGGMLLSICCTMWLFNMHTTTTVVIRPFLMFIYSVITIFSAIIGDFTASMFKREADIKDTGKLIPGHGGMLDRIDSLVSAVPIFTCLILLTSIDDITKIDIL